MALPATNLTLNLNASDADHLWKAYQVGSPYHNGVPVGGDTIEVWQEEAGVNQAVAVAAGNKPIWRTTPLGLFLPALDFDGTDDFLGLAVASTGAAKLLSSIITNSTFTLYASIYVEGVSGTSANPYSNEAIIADASGYWGVHLRNNAGAYSIQIYNYSGANTIVSLPISLNTPYVLKVRHAGGTMYGSLNGGAETSTPSGNTDALTGAVHIGHGGLYYNGRIGELAVYNAAQSAQDQADGYAYFNTRWLTAPVVPRLHRFFAVY